LAFEKNTYTFDFKHSDKTCFFNGRETVSYPEQNTKVSNAQYKKTAWRME
jgi:hypothetical protein